MIKTIGMMKMIMLFHDKSQKIIAETANKENKVTWAHIRASMRETISNITSMKFENPRSSDDHFKTFFSNLEAEINDQFNQMEMAL